jgi:hypothetical protein
MGRGLVGRPPERGASRRKVGFSRAATNAGVPRQPEVGLEFRIGTEIRGQFRLSPYFPGSEAIEGAVPAVTIGVATGHAVIGTGLAAYNGECH